MAKPAKKKTAIEASNLFHNIMDASVKGNPKPKSKCPTCGKKAHNFDKEEVFDCVPPKEVLKFGSHIIDKKYRDALYNEHPDYTVREVVGSYLGHNPIFPSQEEWLDENS